MFYSTPAAGCKSSEIIARSTGIAFDGGWRRWWCEQSQRDGTDLRLLLLQHERVLHEFWQHSQTLLSS
jgi:hypothetical protein